jgi:hypothetical protein
MQANKVVRKYVRCIVKIRKGTINYMYTSLVCNSMVAEALGFFALWVNVCSKVTGAL